MTDRARLTKRIRPMRRTLLLLSTTLASGLAYGQAPPPISLPTLDEGGLIALIALIGVAGGVVARWRKSKK